MDAQGVASLAIFSAFALPITFFDLREMRIPDLLSIGGILVVSALDLLFLKEPPFAVLCSALLGFAVFMFIRLVTGGKMGMGDVKYSAFIALCVGLRPWLAMIAIASVTGLACGLYLVRFRGMPRTTRIPFAPFMTLGAYISIAMTRLVQGIR